MTTEKKFTPFNKEWEKSIMAHSKSWMVDFIKNLLTEKTCIWTMETSKYKAHDYFYHTCHTTVPKHVIKDFKNCPYCGGKIVWE